MNTTNIKNLLFNPNSMTKELKLLGSNFRIKVISHEFVNDCFFRYTNIYLDNLLMMSNISYTNINDKKFFKILITSKNNSIGIELFKTINNITRKSMIVNQINQNTLNNNLNHIKSKFKNTTIFQFERKSVFTYNQEKLFLYEYITQDLIKLIEHKV